MSNKSPYAKLNREESLRAMVFGLPDQTDDELSDTCDSRGEHCVMIGESCYKCGKPNPVKDILCN